MAAMRRRDIRSARRMSQALDWREPEADGDDTEFEDGKRRDDAPDYRSAQEFYADQAHERRRRELCGATTPRQTSSEPTTKP